MRSPKRKFIFAVLLLITLAVVFAILSRDGEPYYQGKSLSQWVMCYLSADAGSVEEADSQRAVRTIGTNGIPFLVRCIAYRAPPWKERLHILLNPLTTRIKSTWVLIDEIKHKQMHAVIAFDILGESAAPAVPALIKILNTDEGMNRFLAGKALVAIGKPAVNDLLAALQSNDEGLAVGASRTIGEMDTNGWSAVPILIRQLSDRRNEVRIQAIATLGQLHHAPDLVVTALTNTFVQGVDVRYSTLSALRQFGTNARSSLPLVISVLNDPAFELRWGATNALREIAPEMFTNSVAP